MNDKNGKPVLVIGGGIAGAAAAVRLGQAGRTVHLIEKQPVLGGHVNEMGCKATDVCKRCNVCVAGEILRSVHTTPNIHIHTHTEIMELCEGKNGNRYTAILAHTASPKKSDSEMKTGAALFMPAKIPGKAKRKKNSKVDADSIIIAAGYEPYNPVENSSYGYGSVPNVITGVEAERQLATADIITRPGDGKVPERIAFIQCVGSRTEEIYRRPEDTDYCSTVCCSYALRIAQQMKYQAKESKVTIFYMDIQNFGKNFNVFFNQCKKTMRFVRSRPYEIKAGSDGSVLVRYTPESGEGEGVAVEEFDLVILAVGIRPPADGWKLADILGVTVDKQGFFGLKGTSGLPVLQREGIFVAGASESPKDIAGSIAQARAVSALILSGQ